MQEKREKKKDWWKISVFAHILTISILVSLASLIKFFFFWIVVYTSASFKEQIFARKPRSTFVRAADRSFSCSWDIFLLFLFLQSCTGSSILSLFDNVQRMLGCCCCCCCSCCFSCGLEYNTHLQCRSIFQQKIRNLSINGIFLVFCSLYCWCVVYICCPITSGDPTLNLLVTLFFFCFIFWTFVMSLSGSRSSPKDFSQNSRNEKNSIRGVLL